ncbi:MAG: hypothetical protein P8Y66_07250 [Nitrospirota bacterium]|jgi:hypothetical protein
MLVYWYGITSFLLGALLFFPTRKFILAMSINRHQRKTGREATKEEIAAIRRKVTVLAALLAVTFAFVYNRVIMTKYFGGLAQ